MPTPISLFDDILLNLSRSWLTAFSTSAFNSADTRLLRLTVGLITNARTSNYTSNFLRLNLLLYR